MTLFQQATAAWNAFNPADIYKPTAEENAQRSAAMALDQQLGAQMQERIDRWHDGLINATELLGNLVCMI